MSASTKTDSAPTAPLPDYVSLVLLVDDQVMIGEAIRRSLANQADIDFHFCPDPMKAVSVAAEINPTVILQDLVMPGMDGIELVRHYRGNPTTRQTPIIVLSGQDAPQVKSDAFAAGANDYLVKLPDTIELLARVRYHSRAFLNQIQRDEAFRALQQSQRQLVQSNSALLVLNQELEAALAQVKQLQQLLPICSYCKKIRSDNNYWSQIESYLEKHSEMKFTHGICPDCAKEIWPDPK